MKKLICSSFAVLLFSIIALINVGVAGLEKIECVCDASLVVKEDAKEILLPHKLRKGDRVGIIAPANTADNGNLSRVLKFIKNSGFEPVVSDDIYAGVLMDPTGEKRANAFNKLVSDKSIKAIICYRGGYGSIQILDKIDYDTYRENRPALIGYSDITALHSAIYKYSKVVTFHGPMLSSNIGQEESFTCLFNMLFGNITSTCLKNIDGSEFSIINEGVVEGRIVGGNMSLISQLMGTPYEIDTADSILFIEDVNEPAYKLNGTLWQLKLAGKLSNIKGIIIGDLQGCGKESLNSMLNFLSSTVHVPIIYNFHAGHAKNPLTVPLGATAVISNNHVLIKQNVVDCL